MVTIVTILLKVFHVKNDGFSMKSLLGTAVNSHEIYRKPLLLYILHLRKILRVLTAVLYPNFQTEVGKWKEK